MSKRTEVSWKEACEINRKMSKKKLAPMLRAFIEVAKEKNDGKV